LVSATIHGARPVVCHSKMTMEKAGGISEARLTTFHDQSNTVLGDNKNFWLWSAEDQFDLTHPLTPTSEPVQPRLKLQCALTPITIDPAKTALVIIDMQNFFMSKALDNNVASYKQAEEILLSHGIPAARKAQIQIIWLTWGLTEKHLEEMDPGVLRTFGWHADQPKQPNLRPGEGRSNRGEFRTGTPLGVELGDVTLENGTVVDAGRSLMMNTWNARLHGPLEQAKIQGEGTGRPDLHFHKNRNSGMCDKMTAMTEYLQEHNIRTLLFTGLNTDQCVMGTLQDAYLKGFDTVLLKDGCGTNSPEYAQLSAEYNCLRSWGFLSSCKDLSEAVDNIESVRNTWKDGLPSCGII